MQGYKKGFHFHMENCIHNRENHICKNSSDLRFSKKEQSNDLDILLQVSLLTPW